MTDPSPARLRAVTDDDATGLVNGEFSGDVDAVIAHIDECFEALVHHACAAGPEAMILAHGKLKELDAYRKQALDNLGRAVHEHIQANGTLEGKATTWKTAEIGGRRYKATGTSGSPKMTGANATRLFAQVESRVFGQLDPDQLVAKIAEADDLPSGVLAVALEAHRHAVDTLAAVYPVTTASANPRTTALDLLDIQKSRYLDYGASSATLGFADVEHVAAKAERATPPPPTAEEAMEQHPAGKAAGQ